MLIQVQKDGHTITIDESKFNDIYGPAGWSKVGGSSQPAPAPQPTPQAPAQQLPAPGPVPPTTTSQQDKFLYIDSQDRYIKVENGQQTHVRSMPEVEQLLKDGFVDYGRTPPAAVTSPTSQTTTGQTYTDSYQETYNVDPEQEYYSLRDLDTKGIDWSNPQPDSDRPYGKMRKSPQEELTQLQNLYRQLQNAVTEGVRRSGAQTRLNPSALKIIGTMPTLQQIQTGDINPILNLYKDAYIYGKYTKDDVINDLHERQVSRTNPGFFGATLNANSMGRRENHGIIHPSVDRDPWIATTFTPVDSAEQPLTNPSTPSDSGAGDSDNPYADLIPDNQDIDLPPDPLITEFGGDETDELYDYILSDMRAANELERDMARTNYQTAQERASEDKAYDVESMQNQYRAAGLYGSGIEQRGQQRLAQSHDRGFQDRMRGYYVGDASVDEIDALQNADVDRLRMNPSDETRDAMNNLRVQIEGLRPHAPESLQYQFTNNNDRLRSLRDMRHGAQRYDTLEKEQSLVEDLALSRWEKEKTDEINPNTGYIHPNQANAYNPYR